jgi:CheY-like chemotaxis protein
VKPNVDRIRFDLREAESDVDPSPAALVDELELEAQVSGERPPAEESNVRDDIEALIRSISPGSDRVPAGGERRRRTRAKICFRVHVRGAVGTLEAFEDVVTTLDASRDGLLLSSSRSGYMVEEILQVVFPYWSTPTALNQSRRARVVRVTLMHNSRYGVAIQFEEAAGNDNDAPWIAQPFPNQVRVLGVESNLRLACEVRELLEQDGYNVVMVSSSQQALDILRYETPHVLLAEADSRREEISGHDLCAIVKKNDRLRHIPVILLTSSAMPSDYAASYKLGAVVCMMRPCQPQLLQRAVRLVAAPPTARTVYSGKFNIASYVRTS